MHYSNRVRWLSTGFSAAIELLASKIKTENNIGANIFIIENLGSLLY
jgi:hypothetical protein